MYTPCCEKRMPIRFRCAYCNQLMAIASRKAGTVVSCPELRGDIIVPALPGTPQADENTNQPINQAFDDPDFDVKLDQADNLAATVKAPWQVDSKPMGNPGIDSSLAMPFRLSDAVGSSRIAGCLSGSAWKSCC